MFYVNFLCKTSRFWENQWSSIHFNTGHRRPKTKFNQDTLRSLDDTKYVQKSRRYKIRSAASTIQDTFSSLDDTRYVQQPRRYKIRSEVSTNTRYIQQPRRYKIRSAASTIQDTFRSIDEYKIRSEVSTIQDRNYNMADKRTHSPSCVYFIYLLHKATKHWQANRKDFERPGHVYEETGNDENNYINSLHCQLH
jgi:hypothetical protein